MTATRVVAAILDPQHRQSLRQAERRVAQHDEQEGAEGCGPGLHVGARNEPREDPAREDRDQSAAVRAAGAPTAQTVRRSARRRCREKRSVAIPPRCGG